MTGTSPDSIVGPPSRCSDIRMVAFLFVTRLLLPVPFFFILGWTSLVTQLVKKLPAMQETLVQFLGREDPLEKEMATHSSILAWRIQWAEEPGRLQSIGSQELDTTYQLKQATNQSELIYSVVLGIQLSDSVKCMLLLLLLSHFSCVQLCATPWTAAHQAPLSTGFSRQEYWGGLPFPSAVICIHKAILFQVLFL